MTKNKKGKIVHVQPAVAAFGVSQPTVTTTATTIAVEGTPTEIKFVKDLMIGIIIVLFIGFGGMFVATAAMLTEALQHKTDSYESLQDSVQAQNAKMDALTSQLGRSPTAGAIKK